VDFNQIIDRKGTHCTQWDYVEDRFGQKDLLPFTISDTDFALPDQVKNTLVQRLAHGVFGYTRWDHADLKQSVKKWYGRRFGNDIEEEWIIYSPSVMYSISQLIKMYSREGEGIVLQTPAYDAFYKTISGNKRKIVENPLSYSNGQYSLNFMDLEKKLSKEENRILLLCSPHNPTGRVWTKEELEKIILLCKKYDVFIISDEIHMDVLRHGKVHHPIVSFVEENVALVTSGSKTFNFPGLIFSYVLLPRKKDRQEFLYRLKNQDGLSSASTLGLEATISAYNECEEWVEELNQYIDSNILYVKNILHKYLPRIVVTVPESTYLMWIDVSALGWTMEEIQSRLLNIGKVAIMDGEVYGGNGQAFLRLNVGCPRRKLEEGMERLILSLTQ
jgi:cystathionine beta-lyase